MTAAGIGRLRILALAACGLYAVLALGSGLDRRAEYNPSLAAKMPWPFARRSLAAQGQAHISSHHFAEALESGKAAVLAAPIEPVSPALLGAARLGLGDASGAEKAFLVAGQMGWRIPMTQGYWMQRAIAAGDYTVAALRLDALLRQSPDTVSDYAVLQPFESDANGRRAMIARLQGRPGWLVPYANLVTDIPRSAVPLHTAALQELANSGMRVGCDTIGPPVISLTELGDPVGARQLWRSHCSEAGSGLISDPDLAIVQANGARSAFEWSLIGNSDLDLTVLQPTRAGEGGAVEIHNSSTLTRTILRQMVVVPAGTYRISWQAIDQNGKASPQVTLSTGCSADGMVRAEPLWSASDKTWYADLGFGSECQGRWIEFGVLPAQDTLRLSNIRLISARAL